MFSSKNTSFVFRHRSNETPGSGYRAELESRMTPVKKPVSRQPEVPAYAKIDKSDTRSHHCPECDKLLYEIERLQLLLEDKPGRGTRMAVIDSRESNRMGEYRQNSPWKASWAATPDLVSTHSKGDGPQQKRQLKDVEEDFKRLKRELHQKNMEIQLLREAKTRHSIRTVVTQPVSVVEPKPEDRLSELYTDVYINDWAAANQVLLTDKVKPEDAASKLIGVLTDAFGYCENLAPDHLEAIIKTCLSVKPRTNIPQGTAEETTGIQEEAVLFRRNVAEETAKSIIKNFRAEVFMKKKDFTLKQKQNQDILNFVDKCVNITWLMAVQPYPIVLDDSVSRDKPFKYETYVPFDDDSEEDTATYDYLVWPALFNAESNTILCRGIAQKRNRQ